jgi:hypothetical protein
MEEIRVGLVGMNELTQARYGSFLRITAWAASPTFLCCRQFPTPPLRPPPKKSPTKSHLGGGRGGVKSVDWNPIYIPHMCLSRKHSDVALLPLSNDVKIRHHSWKRSISLTKFFHPCVLFPFTRPNSILSILAGIRQVTLCMLVSVCFHNLVTYAQRLQDLYSACLMFWMRTHTGPWFIVSSERRESHQPQVIWTSHTNSKILVPDGARTPNLSHWSRTRYHCLTGSLTCARVCWILWRLL